MSSSTQDAIKKAIHAFAVALRRDSSDSDALEIVLQTVVHDALAAATGPRPLVLPDGTPTIQDIQKQLSIVRDGGFNADGAHLIVGRYASHVAWLLDAIRAATKERDQARADCDAALTERAELQEQLDLYSAKVRGWLTRLRVALSNAGWGGPRSPMAVDDAVAFIEHVAKSANMPKAGRSRDEVRELAEDTVFTAMRNHEFRGGLERAAEIVSEVADAMERQPEGAMIMVARGMLRGAVETIRAEANKVGEP